MVDIRVEHRPTGLSRTLPNLLTQESINGNEEMPSPGSDEQVAHYTRLARSRTASKVKLKEIADLPVQAYLQKPFTAQTLLVTLDQVLHGEKTDLP